MTYMLIIDIMDNDENGSVGKSLILNPLSLFRANNLKVFRKMILLP